MKRICQTLILLVFSVFIYAQPPLAIQYQAVVRDAEGILVTNQRVAYEISIKSGSIDGTTVYTETHIDTTTDKGLSTLMIGKGTPKLNSFSSIDWSYNDYFIQISIDINGGTDYTEMGTSQLLSVPYALYADNSDKLDGVSSEGFAASGHTHPEYALVGHTHTEYAPVEHGHPLMADAKGAVRYDGLPYYGCENIDTVVWNGTYDRYEITITDTYYSIDDAAIISISGNSGNCPAGSDARQSSVSGKLLVYIVAADGSGIQCSFRFVVFLGN